MKAKPAVVMVYCISMPDRLLDPLLLLLLLLRADFTRPFCGFCYFCARNNIVI